VKLGPGVDENNIVSPFYAVARNNVVIPEYVIDRYGNYPTSREEARRRFELRRENIEPVITQKYDLSQTVSNEVPRYFFGFCFALVSPIAIPVRWFGEAFSSSSKRRSLSEVAANYFESSFNPPQYEKPHIKERVDYFY